MLSGLFGGFNVNEGFSHLLQLSGFHKKLKEKNKEWGDRINLNGWI